MTRLLSGLLRSALVCGLVAPLAALHTPRVLAARGTFDIYFIDVEGGQSTLMVTPGGQSFLIDAGFPADGTFASTSGDPTEARDAQRILAAAHDAGIQRIDYLMLTHYHADHAGGVAELAQLLPITTFIDHEAPTPEAEAGVPGTQAIYDGYVRRRGFAAHISPKPGDKLPIKGIDAYVVSSVGSTLSSPLKGAHAASGTPNAACAGAGLPAQEKTENPRSTGVRVQFGKFSFLDVGDLSGPALFALTCPTDMIGLADVYLIAHHGGVDAADPAMFKSIKPLVAIFNNGSTKGGAAETLATLRRLPSIDSWQLHRSLNAGAINVADERIANLTESTNAWIKLSAKADGSFTITNARTGASKSYRR